MTRSTRAAVWSVVAIFGVAGLYLIAQLWWPIELVTGLRRDAVKRERALLYDIDQHALASELRKFAYEYRWWEGSQGDMPSIFWPNDPAIPPSLRTLQPTSIAIFDDRIMFERGGPLHHFGIVVFRQAPDVEGSKVNGSTGEYLLKKFEPGVWFYSDYRKLPFL
jgi:hypothetical protein